MDTHKVPFLLEKQVVYQNKILSVYRQRLRLDGGEGTRFVVELPPRVMILPLQMDGTILALEEYNFGAERWQLTLPGGKAEGEDLMVHAQSELRQETGFRAGCLTHFLSWQSHPGSVAQMVHAFVASDLVHDPLPSNDAHECLRPYRASLSEALSATSIDYRWDPEAAFALWVYASSRR